MKPLLPIRGFLTPEQAAQRLGVPPKRVYQLIHNGPLIARRRYDGRRLWIAESDLATCQVA